MSKCFKILSIDGGGIRGIIPAHIIKRIADDLSGNVCQNFDLIAGTSTGSIIAAALACEISPDEILDLYKKHGAEIFCSQISLRGIVKSKYKNTGLKKVLEKTFKNRKLGEIKLPLILPACDLSTGKVHVLKSAYSDEFVRDKNVLICDAVLASCSAPTFFDPHKVNEFLLADGGVWANNPSLVALTDALYRLKQEFNNIKILSLGTGHYKIAYGANKSNYWGFGTSWKRTELIEFICSMQTQSIDNYLNLLLKDRYFRLSFTSDKILPLDDCSKIADLQAKAEEIYSENYSKIKDFLEQ